MINTPVETNIQEYYLSTKTSRKLSTAEKRLARQQKHTQQEILTEQYSTETPISLTGRTRSKAVRWADLVDIEPLTETQENFFTEYKEGTGTGYIMYGSAGSGKTFLALWHALMEAFQTRENPEEPNKKIVIVRSSVQSRNMGALPGDIDEKMAGFEAPYHSICTDLFGGRKDAYESLKSQCMIEFHPSAFLRGTTFHNTIIIVDEFQNMNWQEIKTIVCRLGKNSKIILCGDHAQNDLIYNKNDTTGFHELMKVSDRMIEMRKFRFRPEDIVRSGFVKSFIIACEEEGV